MTPVAAKSRGISVSFQPGWGPPDGKGLLGDDARVRLLRRVLVSYPEVRHIRPHQISLDLAVDPRLLETVARFLERQQWLVKAVEIR
ncbi:MAG: hypothetical protein HY726_23165 [Candidatus Rokubacteria bacterium]|nr:hypothetical protein [Candidatus Rokubacteria bacterium]